MQENITLNRFKIIWTFRSKLVTSLLVVPAPLFLHLTLNDIIHPQLMFVIMAVLGCLYYREMKLFSAASSWEHQDQKTQMRVLSKGDFFIRMPGMAKLFQLYLHRFNRSGKKQYKKLK